MANKQHRRQFLRTAGLTTLGLLAGCTGSSPSTQQTQSTVTTSQTQTKSTSKESVEHDHQNSNTVDFSDETLEQARAIGKTVQKSVVKLTNGSTGGTGWIIEDGYIMTNSHVVLNSETMAVETFDGNTGTATRVGYHQNMVPDIALMKTEIETPAPLPVKTDVDVSKGDPVLMVGHPGSVGDWVISVGRYDSYQQGINWVLSDIPTKSGNSGSPLVTLDGVVIGCVSGESKVGGQSGGVDRPEKVYTEFPEPETKTTATPSETIQRWVGEWK
ncbi:serine protease [Haladaptatus sp. DJG-WS-42]|uniref:S1 family peptidase n=1 Tax=Haladaptatus sp. DJG-WS-42 TaxID=3120516 RepID=UPI0030D23516